MGVHITLFPPDCDPIDLYDVEVISQLLPDLTFTVTINGTKKVICTSLPYLIERDAAADPTDEDDL